MPLRSVEAATRDDAIAAAREQFGPTARVVGVRRVRSGGVLGFFATERYVAEVDPDHPARAAGRDRESVRSSTVEAAERAAVARRAEMEASRTAPGERPGSAERLVSPDRVAELAGLLSANSDEPVPTYSRASVSRAARETAEAVQDEPAPFDAAWFEAFRAETARTAAERAMAERSARPSSSRLETPRTDAFRSEPARFPATRMEPARMEPARMESARREPAPAEPANEPAPRGSLRLRAGAVNPAPAPWSFAAAVLGETDATSGKDDERDAPSTGESLPPSPFTAALARMVAGDRDVRQAVQAALDDRDAERSGHDEAEPLRPRATRSAATSATTGAGHQEEESVTEQGAVTPSRGAEGRPTEFPWAAEPTPEPAAESVSRREEAIAEVLRDALTQGHSDEALADILRKVLASTAPHVSLPEAPIELATADLSIPERLWTEPAAASPWDSAAADDLEVPADAPIWAEVVLHEPASELAAFEQAAAERAAAEQAAAEQAAAEQAAAEQAAAEQAAAEKAAAEKAAARRAAAEAAADARAAEEAAAARAAEEAAAARAAEEAAAAAQAEASAAEERAAITTVATPMARTASDPAPLLMDATTIMPPLSLLPPLPSSSRRSGLPPVPPAASRSTAPTSSAAAAAHAEPAPSAPPVEPKALATVVRLPIPPHADEPIETVRTAEQTDVVASAPVEPPAPSPSPAPAPIPVPRAAEVAPAVETTVPTAPAVAPAAAPDPTMEWRRSAQLLERLRALGVPDLLLGPAFVADAEAHGTYAALTRALAGGLPMAPEAPDGAGEVLFVVGPGVDTLRAARSLAASLRLDPERVQWASRGDLAGLAPKSSRVTTIEAAIERRTEALETGTVTIVAVDAPLRTDAYWIAQMLAIWTPAAVWAVVDATRKPENVEPWLDGLPRVDALMVQDTDLAADPAALLDRIAVPVALLDGVPATPHRWASLLCERLETQEG